VNPAHGNANLQVARLQLAAGRAVEALPHAERARGEGPVAAMVYAEALHGAGQTAAARDALTDAKRVVGNDVALLFALAVTQDRMGIFDQAEEAYSQLLTQRPDDPKLLFRLGRSAARAGHFDRAIRALETAARLTPADVDVLLELGRAQAASENATKAVYVLAHARKLAPRRADVLLTLAQAAEQAGYYGDSALAYDEYLALQPGDQTAKRDRALVYGMTQSRVEEGFRDLHSHVAKYPTDALAWFSLARLTWASDTQQALSYLDHAVRADGASVAIRYARGWLLYRAGRAAESVADLIAAVKAAPKNVEVLAQLGLTYLTLDKPAEAEVVLRRALAQAPHHPEVLLHLGRSLVALDRSDEAQTYLTKFQQLRPAVMRGPRTEPGMIESATIPEPERLRREIDRLRADLEAHPGDVEIRLHLAGLLLAGRHREEAEGEFKAALERGIDSRLAHRTGKALLNAREYGLSQKFLQKAAGALPEARLDLAMAAWLSSGPRAGLDLLNTVPETEQSADSLLLQAKLLDADGKEARSLAMLEAGLQRSGRDPRVACEAASLLVKHGRSEQALQVLNKPGDDARLATVRAGVLASLDRQREADDAIKAAEQRWPDYAPTYLMQAHILARRGRAAEARMRASMAVSMGIPAEAARCLPETTSGCDLRQYLATAACESGR
jgi:tetratricopeptide (TPR) repeat protein